MSTFFLTSIITVSAIIIIKLLIENNKLKNNLFNNNDDQLVDENKTNADSVNQFNSFQENSINKTKINSETPSKNAFLHGADSFGEMKKGVVLDGKTYTHYDDKDASFKIQPAPKKGRNKK
jgi:hypothetical protein